MLKASILLVEDEENLGKTLHEYLEHQGHQCFWASTSQKANELFQKHSPNVILMDIGLPDGNGLDLARSFRQSNREAAILFLSALNDPETRVQGLEIGAEDYITKPFALKELILRLERILLNKERNKTFKEEIQHGPLKIWFSRYEVQDAQGNILNLGQKQIGILQILYKNKGEAIKREDLISDIWGNDKFPTNRTVDNYIVDLRKWCETDSEKSIEIQSVRGVGYKLLIHQ